MHLSHPLKYIPPTKQQEIEYKYLLGLCKELNAYPRTLPLHLQYQFNGDIKLDEGKWVPNPYKITVILTMFKQGNTFGKGRQLGSKNKLANRNKTIELLDKIIEDLQENYAAIDY
jgi:hypothetical protein